ncbi:MAG: DUF748 domain-containing protein [Sulfurospirillaceae bacterium]|nr:DUF748 domain-containing protein [Sulfurospirillaceae bacterium]
MRYLKSFKFWILVLISTYTLTGFILIPWFLTNKAPTILKNKIGINLQIANASFNPYSFELTLHDITLQDLSKNPVFSLKRLYINYTLLGLLDKTVLFKKISINSPKLYAGFQKDGKINLANILPESTQKDKNTTTSKISLPHIVLSKLEITNGAIKFSDKRENKNFTFDLGPYNFVARDVSTKKDQINSYSFTAVLGKESRLFWEGGMGINPLKIYGIINVTHLSLPDIYKYAVPNFDATLDSGFMDFKLPYQIAFTGGTTVRINQAILSLSKLSMNQTTTNQNLFDIPKLKVSGFNLEWPKQSIYIDNIDINSTSINPILEKDGKLNFLKVFAFSDSTKKENNTTVSKPWDFLIANLNTNNMLIQFTDNTLQKPLTTEMKQIKLRVKNISSKKEDPIGLQLSAILNKNTNINLTSSILQTPLSADSKLALSHFAISDFNSYIDPFVNFKIKNASVDLNASIKANLDKKPSISLNADTKIYNLLINSSNNTNLIKWKNLQVNGIKYTNQPLSIDIKSLSLLEPYFAGHIYKNRQTNFSDLIKQQKSKSQDKSKTKQKLESKNSLKLKIGPIKLINGIADFSDASLPFPFKTHIHGLNGDISTLDFGTTTPSVVKLDGKIDKYGYADIKGTILPFHFKKRANIDVLFKNINLTTLTPYSGKFLGYKIKSGKLSMDLNYKISNASLLGKNKINLDTLNLGEQVKSKEALNLPLNLAIALLKDSKGQIDINLPVSGDMNSPDFSYGGVVWRAIGNMITGIVTAPFRFLGSLLGIKGEDLKTIDFAKGSAIVISTEYEKLDNLKKILQKRPNIKLKLSGGYDEVFDVQELQKKQFDIVLQNEMKIVKKDQNATKEDLFGLALKNLYTKDFGIKRYNDLKNNFMIVPKKDDNTTKKSKKEEKPKLNVLAFNTSMQDKLRKNIKISKYQLIILANKRANQIKDILVKKYKINKSRVMVLVPILEKAKRDMWIGTKVDIAI